MTTIPASWVQDGFVAAYRVNGILISARDIDVTDDGPNTTFMIRLSQDKSVLPSLGRIEWGIRLGSVRPGSVQGAYYVIVGVAQKVGGQVRVTARIVRTETAAVLDAAKADGPATKEDISRAITSVLTRLWRSSKWA
jgi:hypothetical protein